MTASLRPSVRPRFRGGFLSRALLATCVGTALLACGIIDDSESSESALTERDTEDLFGNDRVGQLLKRSPERAPRNYEELEQLFQIGRSCVRKDSKEIFVVEESGTRDDTGSSTGGKPLPRTVTTGCNPDPQNAENIRFSYSLMTALVSSSNKAFAPDPDKGDTIVPTPLEVMALDETTGLYNFYKFFSTKPGERAIIMRVVRNAADQVFDILLFPGDAKPTRKPSVATNGTPTRRCFGCHVNGGPLMNELEDPWTNWVSFRHQSLDLASFSGRTQSLVSEAVPNPEGRSSFAKGLEDPLKAAMRIYVNGTPGKPDTGIGAAILGGRAPGGVERLLRSVFCETELNYKGAFDEVPYELFFDPTVLGGTPPIKARVNPSDPIPHLLPVRSEMDRRLENFVQRSRLLTPNTILAARLLDEENDVLSPARCKVHEDVVKNLPKVAASVDPHVRNAIKKAAQAIKAGPRRTLLDKLVDEKVTPEDVDAAKNAYAADVKTRFEQKTKLLETAEGRAKLRLEVERRKGSAVMQFPPPATPLPEEILAHAPMKPAAAAAPGSESLQLDGKGVPSDPHEFEPPRK
jgi:hypothetical protein